jgi:replicative DNA helicase
MSGQAEIVDAAGTVARAAETFCLTSEGLPELIPTGFTAVDDAIGGLGPQAAGILAAATGVGKSGAVLSAMLNSKLPVGLVSLEDGPDVVGTRILAAVTGIDSMKIRKKDLSATELKKVRAAIESPGLSHMYFAYNIAGHIREVEESIAAMLALNVRLIYIDYVQEIGGTREDRRNEVTEVFKRCHYACAKGDAALMMVSQFKRLEDGKAPQIYHLKESGDLENKARIIILAHKQDSPDAGARVRFRLAKSTYGGEYVKFDMIRDPSGTLRPATYYTTTEAFKKAEDTKDNDRKTQPRQRKAV